MVASEKVNVQKALFKIRDAEMTLSIKFASWREVREWGEEEQNRPETNFYDNEITLQKHATWEKAQGFWWRSNPEKHCKHGGFEGRKALFSKVHFSQVRFSQGWGGCGNE